MDHEKVLIGCAEKPRNQFIVFEWVWSWERGHAFAFGATLN